MQTEHAEIIYKRFAIVRKKYIPTLTLKYIHGKYVIEIEGKDIFNVGGTSIEVYNCLYGFTLGVRELHKQRSLSRKLKNL